MVTYLALSLPIENIFDLRLTAWVYVLSGPNEHVASGDDIGQGRDAWIFTGDPHRNWNIVRCTTKGYRKEPVEAEQELGATIVIGWMAREQSVSMRMSRDRVGD